MLDHCLKLELSVCMLELAEQIEEQILEFHRLCSLE